MYRLHPQTAKLGELIASGAIGEVRMIQSSFGFQMPRFMPEHRLFANDLAGGGILDVGGYPVSMARFIAGAAAGKPFLDPVKVSGAAHLGQAGTDEWSAAVLTFENGIIAQVSCAIFVTARQRAAHPWHRRAASKCRTSGSPAAPAIRASARSTSSRRDGQARDDQRQRHAPPLFLRGRRRGRGDPRRPAGILPARHDLGRQPRQRPRARQMARGGRPRIRDREADAPHAHACGPQAQGRRRDRPALASRVCRRRSRSSRSASRIFAPSPRARSCSTHSARRAATSSTPPSSTAAATPKQLFGDWHASRGVRDESVLIGKGAHTPLCYPDVIGKQLTQSLDRLKTDYVDVYFMHRDNPDVPVGEFVDAMDAEVKRGPHPRHLRRLELDARADRRGERLREAHRQAGLWRALQQLRAGRDAGRDLAGLRLVVGRRLGRPGSKARQIPNFAWSSQGRGFFTERAGRDKRDNEELVRVWYSERNFARRDRAVELAEEARQEPDPRGARLCSGAALPGRAADRPAHPARARRQPEALDIKLTPEQVRWLEGPRSSDARSSGAAKFSAAG